MAGGFVGSKPNPKNQKSKIFSSEVLKGSRENPVDSKPAKISLKGILGLGQTVEISSSADKLQNHSHELFSQISHLEKEQSVLFDQKQKELEKAISALREEIAQLSQATENLDKEVEDLTMAPIIEANEYQIGFLERIRKFIINFRQNINQASIWVEAFAAKKKKRNFFWSSVKNKKKGGEQYLFSNEHSVARSVG